jgi:sarcosine oxidase
MMRDSFDQWREIERATGLSLLTMTGGITIAPSRGHHAITSMAKNCDKHGFPYEILDRPAIKARFPAWDPPEGSWGIYSEDCGILRASLCVQALLDLCRKTPGVTLMDGCKYLASNTASGKLVQVKTSKGTFAGAKVAFCTGAWTANRVREFGLTMPGFECVRIALAYWPLREDARHLAHASRFPVFIHFTEETESPQANVTYGFPEFEKPGYLKMALHHSDAVIDPDTELDKPLPMKMIEGAREYCLATYPGLIDTSKPPLVEKCLYENAADYLAVIDVLPTDKRIFFVGAGHGEFFKKAPAVGRMVAHWMVTGKSPAGADLSPFKVDRFEPRKAKL